MQQPQAYGCCAVAATVALRNCRGPSMPVPLTWPRRRGQRRRCIFAAGGSADPHGLGIISGYSFDSTVYFLALGRLQKSAKFKFAKHKTYLGSYSLAIRPTSQSLPLTLAMAGPGAAQALHGRKASKASQSKRNEPVCARL